MEYELSDKLKYIHEILCKIEQIYCRLLNSTNLTDSEYNLFFYLLKEGEGCSQKEISENTFVSAKTLNSTIKDLEKNEMIELKPGKYPNKHVYLTPKGRKYIQEKLIPILEAENIFFDKIPNEDFDKFLSSVFNYLKIFEEYKNI